jgi:hypothetical protein
MDVEVAADRTDIGLEEPLHAFGATDEVERRDAPTRATARRALT